MEPVRTKRCVVLAMVFAMALGITLGCVPRQSDKPIVAEKTGPPSVPAEKKAEKAEKTVKKSSERPTAEELEEVVELLPQKGGVATPRQAAAEEPKSGSSGEKTSSPTPDPVDAKTAATGDISGDTSGTVAAIDSAEAMPPEDVDFPQEETQEETARRLGPPLVEQPDKLLRFDAVDSIWLDKPGGRLVMVGEVCQRRAPLEMFVCLWHTKEHEAVLTVRVPAYKAHAGLLALGAKAGHPVQFMPKYVPASGSVVDIEVIWKDKDGKVQKSRGQDWVRNFQTKKPLQRDWVFAGSGFWTDEKTGKKYYQAEGGDFICVSNFSTAMLDLPVKSSQQNEALMFEAFTERIPPLGTPVTIVLKPRLEKDGK